MNARLLRDRGFFEAVRWHPICKVVMDCRSGQVLEDATNEERRKRHLPVPWTIEMLRAERGAPPVP